MEDMEASSSGKRKSEEDDDETCSATRVFVRSFASAPNNSGTCSSNENRITSYSDLKIVVSGVKRRMRHYHPEVITRALSKAIGEYEEIRVLPSGDLNVTCKHSKQASRLLECDILKDGTTSIPIKSSLFSKKTYGSRAVISGVPIEATESELVTGLSKYSVSAAKRLKRKVNGKYEDCLSVLLFFRASVVPESVTFGYLYFRTKPYNPPPLRCHNCNRYGHIKDNCRGKACCSKCGSREHEYQQCDKSRKCVNCHMCHSAAYGGCPVYKEEAKIQVIRERSNVPFSKAREIFLADKERTISPQTFASTSSKLATTDKRTFSAAVKRHSSKTKVPSNALEARVGRQPSGSSSTITSPVPNDCDIQHVSKYTSIVNASPNTNGDANDPHQSLDPVRLLALVAQVVKLTISAVKSGDYDIFAIVSSASSKYLGISTDPQSLENSLKLGTYDAVSPHASSVDDSQTQ